MPNICDNQKCRDHVPLPASLPEDAIVVRVEETPSYFAFPPPSEAMPWDEPVIPRLVVRYRYILEPGHRQVFLCEDCHLVRQGLPPS